MAKSVIARAERACYPLHDLAAPGLPPQAVITISRRIAVAVGGAHDVPEGVVDRARGAHRAASQAIDLNGLLAACIVAVTSDRAVGVAQGLTRLAELLLHLDQVAERVVAVGGDVTVAIGHVRHLAIDGI